MERDRQGDLANLLIGHGGRCPHHGCELPVLGPQAQVSGRGLLLHLIFRWPASRLSLAFAAASPVRSSELLDGYFLLIENAMISIERQPADSELLIC